MIELHEQRLASALVAGPGSAPAGRATAARPTAQAARSRPGWSLYASTRRRCRRSQTGRVAHREQRTARRRRDITARVQAGSVCDQGGMIAPSVSAPLTAACVGSPSNEAQQQPRPAAALRCETCGSPASFVRLNAWAWRHGVLCVASRDGTPLGDLDRQSDPETSGRLDPLGIVLPFAIIRSSTRCWPSVPI